MLVMFNLSVNGKSCGSTPLLYQALRAARERAYKEGITVDVDAVADNGASRRVSCLPDGTLCRTWMQ